MEIKQPKSIQVKDFELSKIQGNFKEFAEQFSGLPFLTGVLLSANGQTTFQITTSGLQIAHGLQRVPVGWILIDNDSNATIWRASWDDKFITFDSSSTSNIKVWVF